MKNEAARTSVQSISQVFVSLFGYHERTLHPCHLTLTGHKNDQKLFSKEDCGSCYCDYGMIIVED